MEEEGGKEKKIYKIRCSLSKTQNVEQRCVEIVGIRGTRRHRFFLQSLPVKLELFSGSEARAKFSNSRVRGVRAAVEKEVDLPVVTKR